MTKKCQKGKYKHRSIADGKTRCLSFRNFIRKEQEEGMAFHIPFIDFKKETAETEGWYLEMHGKNSEFEYRGDPHNFRALNEESAIRKAKEYAEAGFLSEVFIWQEHDTMLYSVGIDGRKE
jgi:hypothetical protein